MRTANLAGVALALAHGAFATGCTDTTDESTSPVLEVAAVQYGPGDHEEVPGCVDDLCGLAAMVRLAAAAGAEVIVLPEYALRDYELTVVLSPEVGDEPATDERWPEGSIMRTFAELADTLDVTVVLNLIVYRGSVLGPTRMFNASVAFGPHGAVRARHFKFELFDTENSYLTAGDSVEDSFLYTPAGRAGLMICADAHCIVTDLHPTSNCSAHAVEMLTRYADHRPDIVLFSTYWTVTAENQTWGSLAVQRQIATWADAWVVAANTTEGTGIGGSIVGPEGEPVEAVVSESPTILFADIPIEP